MKILLAGDTHGSMWHARFLIKLAEARQVDAIVQLGDWGYTWPRKNVIDFLQMELDLYDIPMYWIDGNHENFPDLQARGFWEANKICAFEDAPLIRYIPRGHIWEWDGVTFMAMGGAWSIDQDDRTPGDTWWPEETISLNDFDRALKNLKEHGKKIDVFLSHDAPAGITKLEANLRDYDFKLKLAAKHINGSKGNRAALWEIVKEAHPDILFHGHYHWAYQDTLTWPTDGWRMRVTGLAHDGAPEHSWGILDTKLLRAH